MWWIAGRITVGLSGNKKINRAKSSLPKRWRFFYAPKEVLSIWKSREIKKTVTIRSQCFLGCRFGSSFFMSLPAVWRWACISCSTRSSARKPSVGCVFWGASPLDKQRLQEYIGTFNRCFMLSVDKALAISLALGKED